MADEMQAAEASEALAEIRNRQRQVIDLATVPSWYWWAVGALMVVLAVGVDTRTSVDDKDYQVPFRFTGKITKLTYKLGPEQLSEAEKKEKETKGRQGD